MKQAEIWTTLKILAWTTDFLSGKGVENARREAEWLLCAATGMDRVGLYLNFEKPLNETELSVYRGMVSRRGRREPLQHILGSQEFCGLEFVVNADVLIPRYDTETLIAEAMARMPGARRVLDIGTGSGCIAVVLAERLAEAAVTAVDISTAALAVAQLNAQRHGVTVEFMQSSLFNALQGRQFDLVVSNPPYIPAGDIEELEPEVRNFDPRIALDGGLDGLEIYRRLVPEALAFLAAGGWLLVEVGAGQADDVAQLFKDAQGYGPPLISRDPAGISRVVAGQRRLSS